MLPFTCRQEASYSGGRNDLRGRQCDGRPATSAPVRRLIIGSIIGLVLMTVPGVCLADSKTWGAKLAMVDAVRAFCRCADSLTLYKSPPEQLFKQGLHATDNPAEKLLAGMVTSLGIRSAAQVREFCRQESIRLLPISGGSEGNCTGLFFMNSNSRTLRSALSLTMCRRGWVFWDIRKPHPDSIPGISDCTATAPKLVWTQYSHPYDPGHGLPIDGFTTHFKFILFNEHKQLGENILNDKGHMLEAIWHHAADRSPECLRSINALIPRTFLLYNEEECRQFFTSELRGQVPVCGQHAMPGAAGRQMCDSAVDAPVSAGQVAVACQEAANETWWLAKITEADVWWTFDELDWYLSAVAGRVAPGYVNATLVPLFKRVAVFAMRMLHAAMPVKYEGFFQEFSFDFFLDEALRVYFLEINTTSATNSFDVSFFTSLMNVVDELRLARERGIWPSEAPGAAMLPEGMDLGTMELLIYKDWDTGNLEGCD
eukprot:jgi/Mesvir1/12455/Mv00609-RA.1